MSNTNEFIIKNGSLEWYAGPNVKILEIPEGVTSIGQFALRNSNLKECRKIVFPASVKRVMQNALNYNYGDVVLEELEFLGDVDVIEEGAFNYVGYYDQGKTGLTKLTFHGKVGEIKQFAFPRARITELVFPNGINTIGKSAFYECEKLKEVHAPGLKKLGNNAFEGCKDLELVDIPATTAIGEEVFSGCEKMKKNGAAVLNGILLKLDQGKAIPEGVHTVDKFALTGKVMIPAVVRTVREQGYPANLTLELEPGYLITDEKLSGKGLLYALKYRKLSAEEASAVYLFQSGKQFEEITDKQLQANVTECAEEMVKLLRSKGKANNYLRAVEYVMAHAVDIPAETVRNLHSVGCDAKYKKETALLEPYLPSAATTTPEADSDICAPWRKIYNEHLLEKVLKGLNLKDFENVSLADGIGKAPAYLVKCAIGAYIDSFEGKPKHIGNYACDFSKTTVLPDADAAAALLDKKDLADLFDITAFLQKPQLMLPYCRYADGAQITALISNLRTWEDWYCYGATGRSAIIVARGAIMLSETREAMMYAEKCKILDHYAKMRGMDADTLRDTKLADFGLDAKGCKYFDLGATVIQASVNQDLSISLYDTVAKKIVKSLPKKGAEPDKHAAATAELSDLKKNLKKVIKSRNEVLFERFIDGKTKTPAAWLSSYTGNAVLNRVARLLVWAQGTRTFTLDEDGPVDHTGAPYKMHATTAVGVAHPMNMKPEMVSAWQGYFTSRGLKQPFEQVWEPVVDADSVRSDRYSDCMIPFYRFKGREKHGIYIEDYDFHNEIIISFADCSADVERIDWGRHQIEMNHRFQVRHISFNKFTPMVNHVLAYLDRVTVYDRIVKDDVTVAQFLPSFTLAQITEFIKLASENNCPNVTAVLLDFQQKNFPDCDPMEEFTLE